MRIEKDFEQIIRAALPWSKLEGRTVLVSGANGFLPSYLVETLLYLNEKKLNEKVKIIALVRNKEKAVKRFQDYGGCKDLIFLFQDVCQPTAVDGKVDYIVHAASQASPKYFGIDPVGTLKANVLGTYNLLELAREKKSCSFLFLSSGEVYGKVPEEKIPTKEEDYGPLDSTDVRSCYAESKRMGETMAVSWFSQYGVPVKIVRIFHTYGPGLDLEDGRVFADFVSDVVQNRDIVIKSDGLATRPFCYLADIISGLLTVIFKGEVGQAYNLGTDKETSVSELAETLIKLFPEKKLKIIRNEDSIGQGYLKSSIRRACPDISKIKVLGWQPEISIEEGFKRTVESY